jgi:hypothetical protein
MALPKIDVPRYPVTIPSTGEEFIMRPYLVKEEKILLLAMESQDPKQIALAIRNLITSCIEGGLDIDSLAAFDIEKLFLELRAISVGEKIQLQTKCQAEGCEHPNAVEIDITDIQLNDFDPAGSTIKLSEDVGVTMRYPTVDLLGDVEGDLDSLDTLMSIVISCINTIFDDENVYDCKKENIEEVQDFIDNLTSDQFKLISAFFQNTPVLEYDLKFVCEKCEHENSYELRGLQSFFT